MDSYVKIVAKFLSAKPESSKRDRLAIRYEVDLVLAESVFEELWAAHDTPETVKKAIEPIIDRLDDDRPRTREVWFSYGSLYKGYELSHSKRKLNPLEEFDKYIGVGRRWRPWHDKN